jgi:hypothetical protein
MVAGWYWARYNLAVCVTCYNKSEQVGEHKVFPRGVTIREITEEGRACKVCGWAIVPTRRVDN